MHPASIYTKSHFEINFIYIKREQLPNKISYSCHCNRLNHTTNTEPPHFEAGSTTCRHAEHPGGLCASELHRLPNAFPLGNDPIQITTVGNVRINKFSSKAAYMMNRSFEVSILSRFSSKHSPFQRCLIVPKAIVSTIPPSKAPHFRFASGMYMQY